MGAGGPGGPRDGEEEGSMTNQRDEERRRAEEEERLREKRERRGDELREAWRRRHPSEPDDEKSRTRNEPTR